jgi:hypothetical protein
VISIALLLWGLGGASIYVAYFVETPNEFAQGAETAPNRQAYANYIASIPIWAIAVGIIAALTRLLGAALLYVRIRRPGRGFYGLGCFSSPSTLRTSSHRLLRARPRSLSP